MSGLGACHPALAAPACRHSVGGACPGRVVTQRTLLLRAGIQSVWLAPGVLSCGGVVISKAGQQGAAAARAEHSTSSRGHLVLEVPLSEQQDDLLQRVRAVIYAQYSACV